MEQVMHCENCAYWQNGYCVLLKRKQTTVAVVEKQYQIIKPKHGYYKGECLDAEIAPTIDTGVGCWHTLIGESYGTENQMRSDRLTQRGGGTNVCTI